MKNKLCFPLLACALIAGNLTSCNENDEPEITTVETLSGFYIVNNGNMAANLPSSITVFDYHTGNATTPYQDAFMSANGISLGEGANHALIYGEKMYIPMTDSNLIWVVDAATLKVISSIRPDGVANSPRALAATDGKVYASMFTGYVCRIDTVTLEIEKTIETGPNPEQMAVANGNLYVANSDGWNYDNGYVNGSISIIDLKTFTESKIKDTSKVLNPTDIVSNGDDVFVICKGDYATVPSTVKKIKGNDVEDVALGNFMAIDGERLYVINSIYGEPRENMVFDAYNTKTLKREGVFTKQTKGTDSWVDSPACIDVDPLTGEIVIISYTINEKGNSNYMDPCYANIYNRDGSFRQRVECGICPEGTSFVHKTEISINR